MQNSKLRKIFLSTAISGLVTGFSFGACAEVIPTNLVNPGYWYQDEDIRAVLKNRLNENNVYVAPALPFESRDLVEDIVRDSVGEATNRGTALIPVNFSNAHWAGLAIKRTDVGTIKVIYNDSLGSSIDGRTGSALLADILQQINPNVEIIDLQVHQQRDGSSCGAFTAENLIKIAELDVSNLSDNELKFILAGINDAGAIRRSHFYLLQDVSNVFDVNELKPRAKDTLNNLQSENIQLMRSIANIGNLTHDRLSHLNRANSLVGVAAGGDDLEYGVWLQYFVGKEFDKNSLSQFNSNVNNRSRIYGFVIGGDTKLDEDSVVGISYGHAETKVKQYQSDVLTSRDNITSNIFGLYGSYVASEDISLVWNLSYGRALLKKSTASGNSAKQKGELYGGSVVANYALYANDYLELLPNAGISYSRLKFKSYTDSSIKIGGYSTQELDANIGLSLIGFYDSRAFTLIPEVTANYTHPVWNKGKSIKVSNRLNQTILTKKLKTQKGAYKLGAGLTVACDLVEFGGGYEHSIQGKSKAHMGYIKLRVNF